MVHKLIVEYVSGVVGDGVIVEVGVGVADGITGNIKFTGQGHPFKVYPNTSNDVTISPGNKTGAKLN